MNSKDKLYDDLDGYDIEKLCDLILLATKVARDGDMTPFQALKKLHEVDDVKEYLIQLNYNKLQQE
jgi:hypothetical protein